MQGYQIARMRTSLLCANPNVDTTPLTSQISGLGFRAGAPNSAVC